MRDKGIEIVVALLEKRAAFQVTRDSGQGFVHELLRAEQLGYVEKEHKSGLYILSQKGRRLVYSGYDYEAAENPEYTWPAISSPLASHATSPSIDSEDAWNRREKELFQLRILKVMLFLVAACFLLFIALQL